MRIFIATQAFLVLLLLSGYVLSDNNEEFIRSMQRRLENGKDANQILSINQEKLLGISTIIKLYQLNEYLPLWNDASVIELLSVIEYIDLDGLDKRDYLLPGLETQGNCSLIGNLNPSE